MIRLIFCRCSKKRNEEDIRIQIMVDLLKIITWIIRITKK
jgi:hypothetical protein